jgi:hypothetical protein
MGPHPIITHVLSDDRECGVQQELTRQQRLERQAIPLSNAVTAEYRQVVPSQAFLALALRRRTFPRSRIVSMLLVIAVGLAGFSGLRLHSPGAAAFESSAGSRGPSLHEGTTGCSSISELRGQALFATGGGERRP